MAYINNKKVTLGTSYDYSDAIKEIADLLRVGTRFDGKYYLADICQSKNINRWAKNKPFRYAAWNFASDEARNNARRSLNQAIDFSAAKVGTKFNANALKEKYESTDIHNGWEYLQPEGGVASPNRLRDLDGYRHDSIPFIAGFSIPAIWSKETSEIPISFLVTEESEDSLTYKDFPIIQNCYMGVALLSQSSGNFRVTAEKTIGEQGVEFSIPVFGIKEDTYTAYPFISSKKIMLYNNTDEDNNDIYTVPESTAKIIKIVASHIIIEINASYASTSSNGKWLLTYSIDVTNNSGADITFNNNVVQLKRGNKTFFDILESDEFQKTLNTFTVVAGVKQRVVTAQTFQAGTELYNYSRLWVSLQSGKYIDNVMPMAQTPKTTE